MFTYWGRRGALSDFTFELAQEVVSNHPATVSISRSNELYDEFTALGDSLFAVPTFDSTLGALTSWRNMLRLRRACRDRFARDGTRVVINLIPHVWFPLVTPMMKRSGVRHVAIVHEANHHPGDPSGIVTMPLFLRQARAADHVVTLSRYVQARLVDDCGFAEDGITTLFLPDVTFRGSPGRRLPHRPLRILFFGRLLPYKRLDIFLDAIALMRARGVAIEAGVLGAGNIQPYAQRLTQLRVHVENRWLRSAELRSKLQDYDVFAVCHSEASQSGAVAAALGAGMPVIAFDVGGIAEQIDNEVTGLLVTEKTPAGLADALSRLAANPDLLDRLIAGVQASRPQRSMRHFAQRLWQTAEQQMLRGGDGRSAAIDPPDNPATSLTGDAVLAEAAGAREDGKAASA